MSFLDAFAAAHREAQKAFNEGDFEKAFAGLAPDVEWHLWASAPEREVLKGKDAVIRYFAGIRDAVDWIVEAQEFIEAGPGRVVVHQRGRAIGRTTRIAGDGDFFQVWEMREGTVVIREFERREEALEAVDLSE